MSISEETRPRGGVTAGDCARLWQTLTGELIRDLQLVIRPVAGPGDNFYLAVEVISPGLQAVDGQEVVNVWARKEFHNPLHLISVGQLYDLLIVAYRTIDRYFEVGDAAAPPRRSK